MPNADTETVRELLSTIDARVWAEHFVTRCGGDKDLMVAWFANAIMTGYDRGRADERRVTAP